MTEEWMKRRRDSFLGDRRETLLADCILVQWRMHETRANIVMK
jgi:hypothetical protein